MRRDGIHSALEAHVPRGNPHQKQDPPNSSSEDSASSQGGAFMKVRRRDDAAACSGGPEQGFPPALEKGHDQDHGSAPKKETAPTGVVAASIGKPCGDFAPSMNKVQTTGATTREQIAG